jgi:hypothetical protein
MPVLLLGIRPSSWLKYWDQEALYLLLKKALIDVSFLEVILKNIVFLMCPS